MKNIIKKILLGLSSFCLVSILFFSSNSFATNNVANTPREHWIIAVTQNGEPYLLEQTTGKKIGQSYKYDTTGKLVQMSLEERLSELNTNASTMQPLRTPQVERNDDIVIMSPTTYTDTRFVKKREYQTYGSVIKVTPSIGRGGTISYGNIQTITDSFTVNATVGYDFTKKMKASAGFAWQHSVSTNESFGTSFKNDKWAYAYVGFTPKLNAVSGDVYTDTCNTAGIVISTKFSGDAVGYSPIKLNNGFADGRFDLYAE